MIRITNGVIAAVLIMKAAAWSVMHETELCIDWNTIASGGIIEAASKKESGC